MHFYGQIKLGELPSAFLHASLQNNKLIFCEHSSAQTKPLSQMIPHHHDLGMGLVRGKLFVDLGVAEMFRVCSGHILPPFHNDGA